MRVRHLVVPSLVLFALSACAQRSDMSTTHDYQGYASPPASSNHLAAGSQHMAPAERTTASDSVDASMRIAQGDAAPDKRDLGSGAGGERLGERRQPWSSGDVYQPAGFIPGFTRTTDAGGDASTFGVDVDTASYAWLNRLVRDKKQLPTDVRVEELVNAFRYRYAAPADAAPVAVHADVLPCPWNASRRLARVALQAATPAERTPVNLVYLVDVSGSMDERNKLPLVQDLLRRITAGLTAHDRLAIVTYAGSSTTALPPTAGDQRERILATITKLRASGSTNGEDGLRAAYDLARGLVRDGAQTRVVLCSDGDFNVGRRDEWSLGQRVAAEARAGVALNVYGFGLSDYQDRLCERLANMGNGQAAYLDSADEVRRLADEELTGQLQTVAQDVKLQLFFNPRAVSHWRLIGYENRALARQDFNDDAKDGGELGAGQQVTALYELVPTGAAPAGDANPFVDDGAPRAGGGAEPQRTAFRVRLRWQPPGGGTSRLIERDIDAAVTSPDADAQFAAAVASFGVLVQHRYSDGMSWPLAERLARAGAAHDPDGRRAEFIDLLRRARRIAEE